MRTLILLHVLATGYASAPEPYAPLSGGAFTGPAQPLSPDPLFRYVYGPDVNVSTLQIFTVTPQTVVRTPGTADSAFINWSSLSNPAPSSVLVMGPGGLVVDFGTELPAWVELDSPDLLPEDLPLLILGTSEYNEVDIVNTGTKAGVPVAYNGTYRLETNKELYEGVRYGFITVTAAPKSPFTITGFRAVAQAKPVNYTGVFEGDARTTQIYYTAA